MLDALRQDKYAALRFMKKVLKCHGSPAANTTDGLRSLKVRREISVTQASGGRTLGQQSLGAQSFQLPRTRASDAQVSANASSKKFSSVHANVHHHFNLARHLIDRQTDKNPPVSWWLWRLASWVVLEDRP